MGTAERKELEREIRKNDIIDAAERVFFSKGFEASTMDDVAKVAEFSKRTLYVYFKSKEQINFEIMVRGYRILLERMETVFLAEEHSNSLEKIKAMGRVMADFSEEYYYYFNAIGEYENFQSDFSEEKDEAREECYALGEKLLGLLFTTLQSGRAEGLIRDDIDLANQGIVIWSALYGILKNLQIKKRYLEHYHHKNKQDIIEDALKMIEGAIIKNEG